MTIILTKLCGISAPGAGTVKEPLGVDERSPEQRGSLRFEVLVSDLLSLPDPRLGSDLNPVVRHHPGLGVVPAGRVHHGVDWEQACTTTKAILWQLEAGGVHHDPPVSSVDLLTGEPASQLTSLLQEVNHQFLLELPDLWLGQSPLLVVVEQSLGQAQQEVLALHISAQRCRFSFSLQEEEKPEDGDGTVVGVETLQVGDVDGCPGEDLTLPGVIFPPTALLTTHGVTTASTAILPEVLQVPPA